MGIITKSDTFFTTMATTAGLAYNNKYKIEFNVNQSIQRLLSNFSTTGIAELNDNYISLMCKQTTFPSYSMSKDYIYSYGGRRVPVYGDRQYDQVWSATFYNDREHVIREFFIAWLNNVHNQNSEVKGDFSQWSINARVFQAYWMQGNNAYYKTAGYKLNAMFPIGIGAIAVDEDAPITLETFTVDFAYLDVDMIGRDNYDMKGV